MTEATYQAALVAGRDAETLVERIACFEAAHAAAVALGKDSTTLYNWAADIQRMYFSLAGRVAPEERAAVLVKSREWVAIYQGHMTAGR